MAPKVELTASYRSHPLS